MIVEFSEPIDRLHDLLHRAAQSELREPSAMSLATAGADGRPTVRTVILKNLDARGLLFFTSLDSRKGHQIRENPRASLCFFWQPLFEQVLVDGTVETVDAHEADEYWSARQRDSQLAAWASAQSEVLDSRETLERRLAEVHDRFIDELVPRPPYWSGLRVVPERMEFWRSGWSRLHERYCYRRSGEGWDLTLLNP